MKSSSCIREDLESGYGQPSHIFTHSISTASTVGTCGHAEDDGNETVVECMEVVLPTEKKASSWYTSARRGSAGEPRNNNNNNSSGAKVRTTILLSVLLFFGVSFALICGAVLLTGGDTSGTSMTILDLSDYNDTSSADVTKSYTSFWNPVVDIQVVYNPDNPSQYILQDDKDVCQPSVVTDREDETMVNSHADALDWSGVQPIARSMSVLGILPHIQTSDDYFVELSNKNSSNLIELGPDRDWTLSFSGARLNDNHNMDIIFLGEGNQESEESSSFAVCYDSNKSIRLGACNDDSDEDSVSVPLPYSVKEFHVLTLTYCQEDGSLQIYQNTKLAANLEYGSHNIKESTTVSWIGPPQYFEHDDSPTTSSSNPPSSNPSNIAIRHIAYLEKHVRTENAVEIAELALNMSM